MSKQNIMKRLREIREKISLDTVGMNIDELNAYMAARGSLKDRLPARPTKKRARPAVRRRSKAKA